MSPAHATLVTKMARLSLSANEIARPLISVMARSNARTRLRALRCRQTKILAQGDDLERQGDPKSGRRLRPMMTGDRFICGVAG